MSASSCCSCSPFHRPTHSGVFGTRKGPWSQQPLLRHRLPYPRRKESTAGAVVAYLPTKRLDRLPEAVCHLEIATLAGLLASSCERLYLGGRPRWPGDRLAPSLQRPGATREGWLQYYNLAMHRMVFGEYPLTKILGDCAAAVSLLESLPDVDASRIEVFGHSFGGNTTLFHAALDARITFACASGAACSCRHKLEHDTGLEMALVVPGIANLLDVVDLVRCICPRRLLIVSSEDAPYSADASAIIGEARPSYEATGRGQYLEHLRTPGGHGLEETRFAAIGSWLTIAASH